MKTISRRQLFKGLAATSIAGACGYKPYTDEEKNIIIEYFNNILNKIEYEKTRINKLFGKFATSHTINVSKSIDKYIPMVIITDSEISVRHYSSLTA